MPEMFEIRLRCWREDCWWTQIPQIMLQMRYVQQDAWFHELRWTRSWTVLQAVPWQEVRTQGIRLRWRSRVPKHGHRIPLSLRRGRLSVRVSCEEKRPNNQWREKPTSFSKTKTVTFWCCKYWYRGSNPIFPVFFSFSWRGCFVNCRLLFIVFTQFCDRATDLFLAQCWEIIFCAPFSLFVRVT